MMMLYIIFVNSLTHSLTHSLHFLLWCYILYLWTHSLTHSLTPLSIMMLYIIFVTLLTPLSIMMLYIITWEATFSPSLAFFLFFYQLLIVHSISDIFYRTTMFCLGGVALRVFCPPGRAKQGSFALDAGVRALDFFDSFFDVNIKYFYLL